tara:strand:- start:43 stop:624 length:582 start_codon:yes stop_codon:yes gene_type:complete
MITGTSLPFFCYRVDNWNDKKQSLLDILPQEEEKYLESDKSLYTDYYENKKSKFLPEYANFFFDLIKSDLILFALNNGRKYEDLKISNMWWQSSFKTQRHSVHNHGGTGWSCVFYVNFNPKIHLPTKFYTHYSDPWTGTSSEWFPPNIQEGDFIIFPSYLNHESLPNQSDIKRTIISFNILGNNGITRLQLKD